TSRRDRRRTPTSALVHCRLGEVLLQNASAPVQARHDRADRNVEDLRRIAVAEVGEIDEQDDVPEVVWKISERRDGVVLGEPLPDATPVGVPVTRLFQAVVEELVVLLQRLLVGSALDLAAAVDVQVGKNPEEPGAEVRPGLEGSPRAKGAGVGVLNEVLRLLTGAGQSPRHLVDLIGQLQCLLFEADTVACLACQLPRIGLGASLAHSLDRSSLAQMETPCVFALFRALAETGPVQGGDEALAVGDLVVPVQGDLAHQVGGCELEPALAAQGTAGAGRATARRVTQRSHRIPVTSKVSIWTAMCAPRYLRTLHEDPRVRAASRPRKWSRRGPAERSEARRTGQGRTVAVPRGSAALQARSGLPPSGSAGRSPG